MGTDLPFKEPYGHVSPINRVPNTWNRHARAYPYSDGWQPYLIFGALRALLSAFLLAALFCSPLRIQC
eukprot:5748789-Prymnesium_polylepis.1